MREFLENSAGVILVIIIIVVMTWRIAHNINDPNCETEWEAMTHWTCMADTEMKMSDKIQFAKVLIATAGEGVAWTAERCADAGLRYFQHNDRLYEVAPVEGEPTGFSQLSGSLQPDTEDDGE